MAAIISNGVKIVRICQKMEEKNFLFIIYLFKQYKWQNGFKHHISANFVAVSIAPSFG